MIIRFFVNLVLILNFCQKSAVLLSMVMVFIGLSLVLEYSSNTRVINYASTFLLLKYSLLPIFGCKFPFPVEVFLQSTNCWNLWKLGAARFHLQLSSLEIDLNIYTNRRCATQPAAELKAKASAQRRQFFYLLTKNVKTLVKYEVKRSRLFKALTLRVGRRYTDPPHFIRHWQLVLKVLPVLTNTRLKNYSLAAALIRTQ